MYTNFAEYNQGDEKQTQNFHENIERSLRHEAFYRNSIWQRWRQLFNFGSPCEQIKNQVDKEGGSAHSKNNNSIVGSRMTCCGKECSRKIE